MYKSDVKRGGNKEAGEVCEWGGRSGGGGQVARGFALPRPLQGVGAR